MTVKAGRVLREVVGEAVGSLAAVLLMTRGIKWRSSWSREEFEVGLGEVVPWDERGQMVRGVRNPCWLGTARLKLDPTNDAGVDSLPKMGCAHVVGAATVRCHGPCLP